MPRASNPQLSLLPDADDPWAVYAVLAIAGAAGQRLGSTTAVGRLLSGPICAMGITFVLSAASILPTASPSVGAAQSLAVALATPLMLLNADLRAVGRRAGRMVPAFVLGALGTALGHLYAGPKLILGHPK